MHPDNALILETLGQLRRLEWPLVTAESCTGGLISAQLTAHAGVSNIFLGGVVVYSYDLKHKLLGVPEDLLAEYGAVSEPVARAMAEGAVERLGGRAAIAVTGIAGPTSEGTDKPIGLVYIAVATPAGTVVTKNFFNGNRQEIQAATAEAAWQLLREQLI